MALERANREDLLYYLAERHQAGARARTGARLVSSMRRYYRYLVRENRLDDDPTARIEAPRLERALPATLTEREVEILLAAPDVSEPVGLRDRAMLELLYASGVRVSELVGLTLERLNLTQGVVRVLGKGDKERLVPVGEEALDWVERYLREARGLLAAGRNSERLFVSRKAAGITRQAFWYRLRRHAARRVFARIYRRTPCVMRLQHTW